jgi:hypothetical protein
LANLGIGPNSNIDAASANSSRSTSYMVPAGANNEPFQEEDGAPDNRGLYYAPDNRGLYYIAGTNQNIPENRGPRPREDIERMPHTGLFRFR